MKPKQGDMMEVNGITVRARIIDAYSVIWTDGESPSDTECLVADVYRSGGDMKIPHPLRITLNTPECIKLLQVMMVGASAATGGKRCMPLCDVVHARALFEKLGATYEPLPLGAYGDAAMRDESPEELPALPDDLLRKLAPGSGSVH